MASYNEEAIVIANIIKETNKLKAELAGNDDVVQVGKRDTEVIFGIPYNYVVKTRDTSADTIWYRDNWSQAASGTVWDDDGSYTESLVEVCRRRWTWLNYPELSSGSTNNIDITNGDVRLA